MISSKPAEPFLDHDHIEDLSGRIYVVVGNTHPPGAVVSYLKYVPTLATTPWCRGSRCYERVIRRYGVDSVLGATRGRQEEVLDPSLGVTVPVVRLRDISSVYRPRERFQEILRKPKDPVEVDAIEAYERIRENAGVHPDRVGVDGSIAVGIQNPLISDVDLVVYGCKESIEVAETAYRSFDSLPSEVEAERAIKMSETYGIPLDVVLAISPPYKRLYMRSRKREVNIMFSDEKCGRYGERVLVPTAIIEAVLDVEPLDCRSLFYPAEARVERTVDLRIVGSLRGGLPSGPNRVSRIVTYESVYSYPLYRGGEVRVRGVLSIEKPSGDLVVTVGTREAHSYVIPRSLSAWTRLSST